MNRARRFVCAGLCVISGLVMNFSDMTVVRRMGGALIGFAGALVFILKPKKNVLPFRRPGSF